MKTIICRQRGCALSDAEEVPTLCPVCANPIFPEDCLEALPNPFETKTTTSSTLTPEKSEFEEVLGKTPDQLFDESSAKKADDAPGKAPKKSSK